MSVLDDELEERYPTPDDPNAVVQLSRGELEAMRRAAYKAGRLRDRDEHERGRLLGDA
ncbi:hypothetical protein [Bifidobacterium felsineum]|uniref:hypothetical protein n=1 Tax=Bifidobacterium felsineum TaxID=2045440 RepID=UPI001BDBF3DD|nr:hypothetical protein [Bifidobacterium felsineum]MBT1164573.1 hypothetical protein [Bifidobacterium felsineum]